jgi:hypothetical protein
MKTDEFMTQLVVRFSRQLRRQQSKLRCFHQQGVQLESWLKGELLYFLDREKTSGHLWDFDREVPVDLTHKKKKVDLVVYPYNRRKSSTCWIEIKHWVLQQKGESYKPIWYLGYKNSVGIWPDADALRQIPNGSKFILALMTANPGTSDWGEGIQRFNEKWGPLSLRSLTDPSRFPSSFHVGLLRLGHRRRGA